MSLTHIITSMPDMKPPKTPDAAADMPGTAAPEMPAEIARRSVFAEAEEAPLSMHDIAEALASKRTENKLKLQRLATLCQEMADILNTFDA